MSRLIVKNLPNGITENRLRELFSAKGRITDVQLKYTKEGKFRKFGFVGFQSDEEAAAAIEFFNDTCIDTSRINVQTCAALGAEEKPQAWSKYAKDSSTYKKLHKNDSKFIEFMQVHGKGNDIWDNDIGLTEQTEDDILGKKPSVSAKSQPDESGSEDDGDANDESENEDAVKLADQGISDLDYLKFLKEKTTTKKEAKSSQKEAQVTTCFI